jgi:hypothetical protein
MRAKGLEAIILDILRKAGAPLTIDAIYSTLLRKGIYTTRESIRKALERLVLKGLAKRVSRGVYTSSKKQKTLEDFFSKSEQETIITIDSITSNALAAFDLLEYVKKKGIVWNPIDVSGMDVGGAAADESSEVLRTHAHVWDGGIIRVSARLRALCITPFQLGSDNSVDMEWEEVIVEPEHLKKGGTAEILVEKLRTPFVQNPIVLKGLGFNIAQIFAQKLADYDLIEFKHEMMQQALFVTKRKASSNDIAITLIDGSIIPGHLDPDIYPGSSYFDGWPPNLAEYIIDRKRRLLIQFLDIYNIVRYNRNVVFVGAIKRSNDQTLQAELNVYYDASDQTLLASLSDRIKGVIIGPFKKHRVLKTLMEEYKKFKISLPEEFSILSYYIFHHAYTYYSLPLQLDVIFPKGVDEEMQKQVISLLYKLVEVSEKHTSIEARKESSIKVYTLRPIQLVDEYIGKLVKEKKEIIEREIASELNDILYNLRRIQQKLGISSDIVLFTYLPGLGIYEIGKKKKKGVRDTRTEDVML